MSKEGRRSALLIFVAWLAYLVSYIGRSDYSACMLEIINQTGMLRATAGMVSSVFAICNAFGQLASGFVMKKISPVKVIAAELFTVCAINLLFPAAGSLPVMAALWGVNGAMQATLLSGITQIFANTLKEPYLSRGAVLMNTIGAVAGMFNYVLSFLLIRYFNWQTVFFSAAGMLMVLGILWCTVTPRLVRTLQKASVEKTAQETPAAKTPLSAILLSYGTLYVIGGAFFVGVLRESVSLWIPSYMNETFGLSSDISTVITAVVPCLQICGAFLGGSLGRKSRTLHIPACLAFCLSAVCLTLIRMLGDGSVAVTIGLFVINAISMTAALTFLLSLFPIRYVERGGVAVLVGIINFAVHAGDFAASTGIGWLSQFGWQYAFLALCAAAVLGAAICLTGGIQCLKGERKQGRAGACQ